MATTGTQQAVIKGAVSAAMAREAIARKADTAVDTVRRPAGYGLPCIKCHLYYAADLDACPYCKHSERVSPLMPKMPVVPTQAVPEAVHDSAEVEQEREEFLRQFKAQLLEAHAEMANAPEAVCKFGEHHPGETAGADVCSECYERLQERADVLEAALHIDLKDAAQIVYDAVWADPSDPGATYQNAAGALLTEIRKRAGITAVLGPFQPLTH